MPTSKQAKKRVRQGEKKRQHNRIIRSTLRTQIKKVEKAIADNDTAAVQELYRAMESRIDKAARKGIIHKNAAARKKARLAKRLQAMTAAG